MGTECPLVGWFGQIARDSWTNHRVEQKLTLKYFDTWQKIDLVHNYRRPCWQHKQQDISVVWSVETIDEPFPLLCRGVPIQPYEIQPLEPLTLCSCSHVSAVSITIWVNHFSAAHGRRKKGSKKIKIKENAVPLRNSVDSDAQILSGNSWSPGLRFFTFHNRTSRSVEHIQKVQNISHGYRSLKWQLTKRNLR